MNAVRHARLLSSLGASRLSGNPPRIHRRSRDRRSDGILAARLPERQRQRCLADLPRSDERDDREGRQRRLELGERTPFNHPCKYAIAWNNCKDSGRTWNGRCGDSLPPDTRHDEELRQDAAVVVDNRRESTEGLLAKEVPSGTCHAVLKAAGLKTGDAT